MKIAKGMRFSLLMVSRAFRSINALRVTALVLMLSPAVPARIPHLRARQILIAAVAAFAGVGFVSEVQSSRSGMTTLTRKPARVIFVTNPTLDSLSVFPVGSKGNVPSLFTLTLLSNPSAIAYSADKLYVTNGGGTDSITVYPADGGRRPTPIINIKGEKTQLDEPVGIAVNSVGNIFVVNQGTQDELASITIYSAGSTGNTAPIARIIGPKTGLKSPSALALDSHGYIYVTNDGSVAKEPDSITVYAPGSNGNSAPVRTISGSSTALLQPQGIALDSSGNIYVTSNVIGPYMNVAVLIYGKGSNGNVAPIASIDGSCAHLTVPGAIALNASNIYVSNAGAFGPRGVVAFARVEPEFSIGGEPRIQALSLAPILVYGPGGSHTTVAAGEQCLTPVSTIGDEHAGIDQPSGIAVDPADNIYVTNSDTDSIGVFKAGANGDATPSFRIESPNGVSDSTAVAIDSDGKIYVANGGGDIKDRTLPANSVTIYPAGSYANVAPIATIGGATTASTGYADKSGINKPVAIAVDAHGRIFIANEDGGDSDHGNITVYPAGSNGDARPIATIGGTRASDNTGLNYPVALAIDSASNLYVLNSLGGPDSAGSITVYPSTANGNIAPTVTIANGLHGKHTQFSWPAGMALDSAGNIYVTNDGTSIEKGVSDGNGLASITIYAAGSHGDVAPMAIISGSNTGLNLPQGIAIDSHGNLYVANPGSINKGVDTITEYVPGSSGNAAPIATISGPLTGLLQPAGLAVGPVPKKTFNMRCIFRLGLRLSK
jgi:hypothetical protein